MTQEGKEDMFRSNRAPGGEQEGGAGEREREEEKREREGGEQSLIAWLTY